MKKVIYLPLVMQIVVVLCVSCSEQLRETDGKLSSISNPERSSQSSVSSLILEEDIKPIIVRTGTFNVIFFEMDLGIKLVPWRQAHADGIVENGIRLSLGMVPKGSRGEDQDIANLFLFGNQDFNERAYYQLKQNQLTDLITFIETLEKVRFESAPPEITYRMVHANWGDMRFQVSPNVGIEILVFADEQNGEVWSPLNSEHFKQALNLAIERFEKLNSMKKTAIF